MDIISGTPQRFNATNCGWWMTSPIRLLWRGPADQLMPGEPGGLAVPHSGRCERHGGSVSERVGEPVGSAAAPLGRFEPECACQLDRGPLDRHPLRVGVQQAVAV